MACIILILVLIFFKIFIKTVVIGVAMFDLLHYV